MKFSYQALINPYRVGCEDGIEIFYLMLGFNVSFGTREEYLTDALTVIWFFYVYFLWEIGGRSS